MALIPAMAIDSSNARLIRRIFAPTSSYRDQQRCLAAA
jgi:hypothetical protein